MTGPQHAAAPLSGVTLDGWMDVMAGALALPVPAEHRAAVRGFLGLAAEMAAVLEAAPVPASHAPLAPVFRLPEPPAAGDGP